MSQIAEAKVVVLWEEELRIAGKALARLRAVFENSESSTEERLAATNDALQACGVALYYIDEFPDAAVVVGAMPLHKRNILKKTPEAAL